MSNLPTLFIPPSMTEPDNDQWEHRFKIRSESSNRIYIVAQHKKGRYWGCSCPGWKSRRYCKHLKALGLPNHQVPYEVQIAERRR